MLAAAGDVKVVSVGHDHVNNFCSPHAGISLCYGGGTGYDTYGQVPAPSFPCACVFLGGVLS